MQLDKTNILQVFNYDAGIEWRQTNPLPGPRSGGKGVALAGEIPTLAYLDLRYQLSCFVAGVVHFMGGAVGFSRLSSILSWDPVSGSNQ